MMFSAVLMVLFFRIVMIAFDSDTTLMTSYLTSGGCKPIKDADRSAR